MGILEKIEDIEKELGRTQINKATMKHICALKARLAKLRSELLDPAKGSSGSGGEGFEVSKTGSARIALIGFPSVGKSTLLSELTDTESEQAAFEFTTLTAIPGNLMYKGTKLQLLDLPGIIEGAAHGKGRGRQVIACAKSADLVLMVLDAAKEGVKNHRRILERELEIVGMRLNQKPANIYFKKKKDGGVKFNAGGFKLEAFGDDPERTVKGILQEYKMHNAEVLFREDATPEQFIDLIEGNRKYVRCLYVYNKADVISLEEVDALARQPHSLVISCNLKLGYDYLLERIWDYLGLVRVYTKKRGSPPDFEEPVVLTSFRHGTSVESACRQVHRSLIDDFHFALVWGISTKHNPQRVGLAHELTDEDVLQIVKKTNTQLKKDKDYNARVQAHYDAIKTKRKSKGKLKT
ncbi:Developmentally-regulated GTP-binding protein 1 [Hondaea fermentalgiana]|uniref:Developmentally-regulated GTP-binding protein 1 n=1 Tax=Hondaea fermentalgiana TaxID=2315210 RepID=A0A2R5GG46_9STRA|nr:Developmentally-regulated GTP-binding protein 1 [Hondaea fermentalgiana]|eukprot:GBG29857.1 Developmentally-regulated GTP-binding protein 1 [Hondaea fermentalgiana]